LLLQRLESYADRLNLPPRLYSENPVRYIIDLDGRAALLSPVPIDTADPSSLRTRRGTRRLTPSIQRASSVKPLLLADKADYVFGGVAGGAASKRVTSCHAAFMALLDRCASATNEPAVRAVQTFLKGDPLGQLQLDAQFDAGATITFRVDGVFPVDLPSVQSFWAAENDPATHSAPTMQCMVCGLDRPAMERLELKVKGVPGGQTSGTSIISFNAEAFESFGLSASLNAPTCASCGERFTTALNALLSSDDSRVRLDNVVYIFWTSEPQSSLPFAALMQQPDPQQVQLLYESVFSAKQGATKLDEAAFYAAALSGSGGRTVVRDWVDTTVAGAKRHLAQWFKMQRVVTPGGDDSPPLGLRELARATIRAGDRHNPPPPNISASLLRTALAGVPLPHDLLYQAVRRNRAEQAVTRQRAALIKMVLLSQRPDFEEDDMVELDATNRAPAYLCGRLLAVLEQVQHAALPGINATIVDRFYGTASSAPASVFGRLLRGAQPHLARLERDRKGAYIALQRRLEEVQAPLMAFPKTLTLEQQGFFALGYYHERARRWASKPVGDDTTTQASTHDSDIEEEQIS
jgi:CRISPR-associated protein Csd1